MPLLVARLAGVNAAPTPCLIHTTTARPAAIAGSACVSRRCCTSCARDCSKGFLPIPSPGQPGQHNRLNAGFSGKPLNWPDSIPGGPAALSLSNDDLPTALHRLDLWQEQGLSADELQAVLNAAAGSFAVSTALLPAPAPIASPSTLCPVGASPHEWSLHAWLQHLPLPHTFPWANTNAPPGDTEPGQAEPLIVVIGPLPTGRDSLQLLDWAQQAQVWASSAARCGPAAPPWRERSVARSILSRQRLAGASQRRSRRQ